MAREVKVLMGYRITPNVELLQPPRSSCGTSVELSRVLPDLEIEAFEVRAETAGVGVPPIELAALGQGGRHEVGDSRTVHHDSGAERADRTGHHVRRLTVEISTEALELRGQDRQSV